MASMRLPVPLTPARSELWASLAHFGGILGFLPSLLIYTVLGPRSARVRLEAREALNFSLTALIVFVALYVLGTVSNQLYQTMPAGVRDLFFILGLAITLALFAVWIAVVVLSIRAGIATGKLLDDGRRYPFAFRLIR